MSHRYPLLFSKRIHSVAEARNLDVISVFPLPEPKTVPTLKSIHHKLCCLTCHLFYFHSSSSRAPSTPPWTSALGSLQLFILLPNKHITFKTKIVTCLSLCLPFQSDSSHSTVPPPSIFYSITLSQFLDLLKSSLYQGLQESDYSIQIIPHFLHLAGSFSSFQLRLYMVSLSEKPSLTKSYKNGSLSITTPNNGMSCSVLAPISICNYLLVYLKLFIC